MIVIYSIRRYLNFSKKVLIAAKWLRFLFVNPHSEHLANPEFVEWITIITEFIKSNPIESPHSWACFFNILIYENMPFFTCISPKYRNMLTKRSTDVDQNLKSVRTLYYLSLFQFTASEKV